MTKEPIKALENYFEIRCKKCNSTDVTLDYYSGIVSDFGSETGSLYITCNKCGNEIDGYDIED